jgi:hypothetical protein
MPPTIVMRRHHWESYYSPELKKKVRRREKILFQMFPEFDV